MDMSFSLMRPAANAPAALTMADFAAESDARREMIPAMVGLAAILRGQDTGIDHVSMLARLVVSGSRGVIDAAKLGGSFNPLVAHHLMVGKRG
jgi:hypothetical protein